MRRKALCAALVLATVASMSIAHAEGQKTIQIRAHFDDRGATPMPQSCWIDHEGVCTFVLTGSAHWSGTFAGNSDYRIYGHFDPTTMSVVTDDIWEHFTTVSVQGCGRGSMLWHGELTVTPQEQDPTTGQMRGHGTWTFEKGTGTGALSHQARSRTTAM